MEASKYLNFLLLSSFFVQMLVGVVGIAVPIYAVEMGAPPILLGAIGATGGLIYSFMPFISGSLSDKFKRKMFISASTFLYGLSCIFYVLVKNPFIFIPIRAFEWLSIALFWPSTEALLAEISEGELEGALRKFNLSWGSAMIVGPMIGGSLISALGIKAKAPFLLSSIISFSLSLLTMIMIKEPERIRAHHKSKIFRSDGNNRKPIVAAVISILLFASVGGIIFNLFPAYATELGIPAYEVGLALLANGLFRLIAFLEAYRIEKKIGRTRIFLVGSLILSLASALIAIGSTTSTFSISLSILGFGAGILYAVSIEIILKSWRLTRGYAAGIFESLVGIGYFLGPLIGGLVAEYLQSAPYILCSLISLAIGVFQTLYKIERSGS